MKKEVKKFCMKDDPSIPGIPEEVSQENKAEQILKTVIQEHFPKIKKKT